MRDPTSAYSQPCGRVNVVNGEPTLALPDATSSDGRPVARNVSAQAAERLGDNWKLAAEELYNRYSREDYGRGTIGLARYAIPKTQAELCLEDWGILAPTPYVESEQQQDPSRTQRPLSPRETRGPLVLVTATENAQITEDAQTSDNPGTPLS